MLEEDYKINYAQLPDGWKMARIWLTESGAAVGGWQWGPGLPLWWLTNGYDSLTVRAASPVEAIAIVSADGWPPYRTGRYNWEYPKP